MLSATVAAALLGATLVRGDQASYKVNAGCNNDQLMRWFDADHGLWRNPEDNSLYWWQSANMMTAFTDLAMLDPNVKEIYGSTWDYIYKNAPKNNPMPKKIKRVDGTWAKDYTFPSAQEVERRGRKRTEVGFIGHFYDDEGWWGLAFIAALDATGNSDYLNEAIGIWYDMNDAWNRHPCGGIPWNKDAGRSPVAISNELYIALGAALYHRVGADQKPTYLNGAKQGWQWMEKSGIINSDYLVMDGVNNSTCQAGGTTYTYNQGVVLGALVDIYRATGDSNYVNYAAKIADAVTKPGSQLQDADDLLADSCDITKSCSLDGIQFKGVFTRNLRKLYEYHPTDQYKTFLERNAQSIWSKDLHLGTVGCFNGVYWGGPYVDANPSSQSSALDCLNAALAVTS